MKVRNFGLLVVLGVLLTASLACSFSASTAKVGEAQLSRDEAGSDPTTVFAPEDIVYLNVDLQNAPDDTVVKTVWTAVDVENTEPDFVIDETEIKSGSGTVTFNLENDGLWPAGSYKVELFVNDKLDQTLEYRVE